MDIIITVSDEQLALIQKKVTLESFVSSMKGYANGLIAFYVNEGQQIKDAEDEAIKQARIDAFLADEALVAQVDAVIAAAGEEEV